MGGHVGGHQPASLGRKTPSDWVKEKSGVIVSPDFRARRQSFPTMRYRLPCFEYRRNQSHHLQRLRDGIDLDR